MIGAVNILRNPTATDLDTYLGGTGSSARVYYINANQNAAVPYVVVEQEDNRPSNTKDGPSDLDYVGIVVTTVDDDYASCRTVAEKVRTELEAATKGTYGGQAIDEIFFENEETAIGTTVKNRADRRRAEIIQDFRIVTSR